MEKSFELDLGEWELVPRAPQRTFIDFSLGEKGLLLSDDYFSSDAKASKPAAIAGKEECKDIGVVSPPPPMILADHGGDVASIVLFKKLIKDDDKFVDMKIESPRISAVGTIMPPAEPERMVFDGDEEAAEEEMEDYYKGEKDLEKEVRSVEEGEIEEKQACCGGFGLRIWKWKLDGGVGALCSIGFAAATICIFVLGGRQMQKQQQQQQQQHNQKVQFQIYGDDKRINQVVQQATRMNQAVSAARGIPVTRAHVSFGGYYEGL